MLALLPLLLTIVPPIIQAVENKIGSGKGDQKKEVVSKTVGTFLDGMLKASGSGDNIKKEAVEDMIEMIFQILKSQGVIQEAGKGPTLGQQVRFTGTMEML